MLKRFWSMFSGKPEEAESKLVLDRIGNDYRPKFTSFMSSLEFPLYDADENLVGKTWKDASYDPATGKWVVWQKTIKKIEDILMGGSTFAWIPTSVKNFSFQDAYLDIDGFEQAFRIRGALGKPLPDKTPDILEEDYYRHAAYIEGLIPARSGLLYPYQPDVKIAADNMFNDDEVKARDAYMNRYKAEQFLPVPVRLPEANWEKNYKDNEKTINERLILLGNRYSKDKNDFDLALRIVRDEEPEVLYAHMQAGFTPKIFENNPDQHYELLKAAIDRKRVDYLALLAQSGLSFYVRKGEWTPAELALHGKKYSHFHVMLSRDGSALANYPDAQGNSLVSNAIALQDRQAFRMLKKQGLDYTHVEPNGYALIHLGFEHGFKAAVNAWLAQKLPIDVPVAGTPYTGLSIARRRKDQPMIDFAIENGANKDAPEFPAAVAPVPVRGSVPSVRAAAKILDFTPELLNSQGVSNEEIEVAARAYKEGGGHFNIVSAKNLAVLELCWRNANKAPALNRQALIPVFMELGADPAALLPDGTNVLTRITSADKLELGFLKVLSQYADRFDVNGADGNGNNMLHKLQMNTAEGVGHSNNVKAVLEFFPAMDINAPNRDGLSNVGLAIKLDRSQTLKVFAASGRPVAWGAITPADWSMLDIAFTAASRPGNAKEASAATRGAVLEMMSGAAAGERRVLREIFGRVRPDEKRLLQAMQEEGAPGDLIMRLKTIAGPGVEI